MAEVYFANQYMLQRDKWSVDEKVQDPVGQGSTESQTHSSTETHFLDQLGEDGCVKCTIL